jgi:hypothetical protein
LRFIEQHDRVLVVDHYRDAQLRSVLMVETGYPGTRLASVLHYGGLPMDCRCVMEALERASAPEVAA